MLVLAGHQSEWNHWRGILCAHTRGAASSNAELKSLSYCGAYTNNVLQLALGESMGLSRVMTGCVKYWPLIVDPLMMASLCDIVQ